MGEGTIQDYILNFINTHGSKRRPVSTRDICFEYNLNMRDLRYIISDLREDYPILSTKANGGGYWIAEDDEDLEQFIKQLHVLEKKYKNMIKLMKSHLKNK